MVWTNGYGGRVIFAIEGPLPIPSERAQPDILFQLGAFHVSVVAHPSQGGGDMDPARCPVDASGVPRGLDEGLDEDGCLVVALGPVLGQAAADDCENVRAVVGDRDPDQDQEPQVVDHQREVLLAQLRRPTASSLSRTTSRDTTCLSCTGTSTRVLALRTTITFCGGELIRSEPRTCTGQSRVTTPMPSIASRAGPKGHRNTPPSFRTSSSAITTTVCGPWCSFPSTHGGPGSTGGSPPAMPPRRSIASQGSQNRCVRPQTTGGLQSGQTGIRASAPMPALSSPWGLSLLAPAATGTGS